LVNKELGAVNSSKEGTKVALPYVMEVAPGVSEVLRLRLSREGSMAEMPGREERVFTDRIGEADAFYAEKIPHKLGEDERRVARQAYAGLLWSKQFLPLRR
jgi:hypothetical protein